MSYTESYKRFRELLKARNFDAAEALAEHESLARPEDEVFWLTQLAVVRTRAGRAAAALATAERALALAPANRYALLARADARRASGQPLEALADYREAADDPRVEARARSGALFCLARLARWEELLRQLEAWGMAAGEALELRARALAALNRDDEALALCARWLLESPDNPHAMWLVAELEIRRDGLAAVAERFARLARIPSRPPIYGEIYASLCRRQGEDTAAIAAYGKLVANSDAPRLQRKQAFALARGGRESEAIPMLEQLLRDDPRDLYVHAAYTAACRRAMVPTRAWNFYHELLDRHPEEKHLHGRLRKIARTLDVLPGEKETDATE